MEQDQHCCHVSLHPVLWGEGEEVNAMMPRCHQSEHEQLQRLATSGYPKALAAADPSLAGCKSFLVRESDYPRPHLSPLLSG